MNDDNKLIKVLLLVIALFGVVFGVLWALRKVWLVILLGGLVLRVF